MKFSGSGVHQDLVNLRPGQRVLCSVKMSRGRPQAVDIEPLNDSGAMQLDVSAEMEQTDMNNTPSNALSLETAQLEASEDIEEEFLKLMGVQD
mmetsp:Transcript_49765/g.90106  ORF Transcript_49765/g.90106 Transcript_49765/m.90106 type:complete len:93 (-) Transcript_49765:9-287(-)